MKHKISSYILRKNNEEKNIVLKLYVCWFSLIRIQNSLDKTENRAKKSRFVLVNVFSVYTYDQIIK